MATEKVRIGFVGVGGMGQCAHLKSYVTVPECEVVALAELRPKLRETVARKYGIARTYATAAEMLAQEKLDGIVAAQPFDKHGQIIIPLYQARLPVFTEKPLASSIATGAKMLAALKASGTWHMVGYHKRSDPATMFAKAEIDRLQQTGELGKLKYVRILMPSGDWRAGGIHNWILTDDPAPKLAADPAASDMDEPTYNKYVDFVNYYIHQVNLLRHLFGEAYRVTYAEKSGVLLVAESASGVPGTIEMTPYETSIDWQESALVCFERGWIKLKLPAPLAINRPGQVTLYRDPRIPAARVRSDAELVARMLAEDRMPETPRALPVATTPTLPWIHAMRQQAINFCRAIRGEIEPPCDAAEALEDLKAAREYIRLFTGK